jgi:uncharacterized protein (DUF1778 family)
MLEMRSAHEGTEMPNGRVVQINLRLPEDEKAAIERAAYWARLSVSDYIRAVMREAAAAKMAEFGERAKFLPGAKE